MNLYFVDLNCGCYYGHNLHVYAQDEEAAKAIALDYAEQIEENNYKVGEIRKIELTPNCVVDDNIYDG